MILSLSRRKKWEFHTKVTCVCSKAPELVLKPQVVEQEFRRRVEQWQEEEEEVRLSREDSLAWGHQRMAV